MFYAPWCKNSKILYPIYEKLAGKLKNIPNFLIAKFDAFNNDADIFDVEFYPTMAIWPSHNKSVPVTFDGDFSKEEDIMKFIKDNAYNKVAFTEMEQENSNSEDLKILESTEELVKLQSGFEDSSKNASDF